MLKSDVLRKNDIQEEPWNRCSLPLKLQVPSGSSNLENMWGRWKATCDRQKNCTREATQKHMIPGTQKMFALVGGKILVLR